MNIERQGHGYALALVYGEAEKRPGEPYVEGLSTAGDRYQNGGKL